MRTPVILLLAMLVGTAPPGVSAAEVSDHVEGGGVRAEVRRLGDLHHRVTVNGTEVLDDTESLGVLLRGIHRSGVHAWVLVERASGGTACPSTFVAVDASASPPAASAEFGNCSDLPEVSADGDALVVVMPSRDGGADTYVVRGGEVTERPRLRQP